MTDRGRSTVTILAIVVLILLGQATWQEVRVHALRSQLEQSRRRFDEEVAKAATERLKAHRAEMVQALEWLHHFYASPEGLQRPNGLWRDDRKQPDFARDISIHRLELGRADSIDLSAGDVSVALGSDQEVR